MKLRYLVIPAALALLTALIISLVRSGKVRSEMNELADNTAYKLRDFEQRLEEQILQAKTLDTKIQEVKIQDGKTEAYPKPPKQGTESGGES